MLDLDLTTLISRLIVLATAFSVHEFAHAWTANYFGDDTPRQDGRLTLNPAAHLDPLGSLMLIVAGFGWAKPVRVNPYALQRRSPAALMWVALAGPMSNLFMAIAAAIPLRLGLKAAYAAYPGNFALTTVSELLYNFVFINLLLMLFNLLPISPLDGDKIADYLLPPAGKELLANMRPYGPMILMLVIVGGPYIGIDLFQWIIFPPLQFLYRLLVGY